MSRLYTLLLLNLTVSQVSSLRAEVKDMKKTLQDLKASQNENAVSFIRTSQSSVACTSESIGFTYLDVDSHQMLVCNGYQFTDVSLNVPLARSCQQLYSLGYNVSGVYSLRDEAMNSYKTYCDMNGGWTLIMKLDGLQKTFPYNSALWLNKETYNCNSASLDNDMEAKLPSYWSLPFTELRLGMKKDGDITRWITVRYNASSLYSVIVDGQYRPLDVGRTAWKSLIEGSSLQVNCYKEGFNAFPPDKQHHRVRIGIIADGHWDCKNPDSRIGFGGTGGGCGSTVANSCGNLAQCGFGDNGNTNFRVKGYIMAR